MSDVTPFEHPSADLAIPAAEDSVFKPVIPEGFDFAAYEQRQERLDEASRSGDKWGEGAVVAELGGQVNGVMLNNLHNRTIANRGGMPRGMNARMAILSGSKVEADVPGLDFTYGVAAEASFKGRILDGATFTDSVIPRADFRGASLRGVDMTNVVMTEARFDKDSEVSGLKLVGSYVGVPFEGLTAEQWQEIDLRGARFMLASTDVEVGLEDILKSHFGDSVDLAVIRKQIDTVPVSINQRVPRLWSNKILRGLHAQNLNATDAQLTGSDLTGANIDGMTGEKVLLRSAAFGGSIIRRALLKEADMFAARAPGIILEGVDLRGANVEHANFAGSIFRAVDLRDAVGLEKANLEGVVVEDSQLPQGFGYDGFKIDMTEKKKHELESGQ